MGKLRNAALAAKTAFSDVWKRTTDRDLSKQQIAVIPAPRKLKEVAANEPLLRGIYKGSAQEFALASYLVTGMVDVPRNMTGIPGVIPDQGQSDRLVKELSSLIVDEFPVMVAEYLVTGTAWRWARWSDKLHCLVWEAIPDSSITSMIIDLDSGEITELWIDEQLEYSEGEINTVYSNRKRHITKTQITETWKGKANKTTQYKNPFGFMPVPFGHNCFAGEWRGNSVFARVLRLLKEMHDISYTRGEILSEFVPKIIQTVNDVKKWKENNTKHLGIKEEVIDVFGRKLFANQIGETTAFITLPAEATSSHTQAVQDLERKIMKGSGIPELFFGSLATGNHASTETDRLLALEHIKGLRRELTKGTQELVRQSLKILSFMRFTQPPEVSIQWGNLSLLSEMQKAQVMGAYASAVVPLLRDGAVSPEGAFWFTKELYPEFPAEDAAHFMSGLDEMLVQHSSKVGQPAFDAGGMY